MLFRSRGKRSISNNICFQRARPAEIWLEDKPFTFRLLAWQVVRFIDCDEMNKRKQKRKDERNKKKV